MDTPVISTSAYYEPFGPSGFVRISWDEANGENNSITLTVREAGKLACEIVGTPEVKNEIMTWGKPLS